MKPPQAARTGEAEVKSPSRSFSDDRFRLVVLALSAITGIVLCVLLTAPFLGALTWALTLAILFAPVHASLEANLRRPNLAATISVLLVAFVVAVPATFVAAHLVREAATGATSVQRMLASDTLQRLAEVHPSLASVGKWIEQQIDLPALMASIATWLSNMGASFARGTVVQVLEVVLTFYLLYYFLRDRHAAVHLMRDWLPLTEAETDKLFRRVIDTVHATIYGTLAVSLVQGMLGGFMFWLLGLQAPILWGVVMGLLAIVPALGAFVVWIPAAVFLALEGSWEKAAILTVWGAVVVGGVDNILHPMFVGNRMSLHTVPAFISIIGGLMLFGAYGFVLGPLVASITIFLIQVWAAHRQISSQQNPQ